MQEFIEALARALWMADYRHGDEGKEEYAAMWFKVDENVRVGLRFRAQRLYNSGLRHELFLIWEQAEEFAQRGITTVNPFKPELDSKTSTS